MNYDITIPAIQKEWQVPSNQIPWKDQAIKTLKKIKSNYGQQFVNASNYTGVPLPILYGFSAVESGGALNNTLDGFSKGLMQVNPDSCWQTLRDQLKVDTLQKFYPLYQAAPNAFDVIKPMDNLGYAFKTNKMASEYLQIKPLSPSVVTYCGQRMVADAQFAVYIGSLILAKLIAGTMKSVGQVRLDHIVIKYNAGSGRFRQVITSRGLESPSVDTTQVYNNLPIPVSQAYIVKLLGINGYMDIQKKGLA